MSDSAVPRIVWQLERVAREIEGHLAQAGTNLAAVRAAELDASGLDALELRHRKEFLLGQVDALELAVLVVHQRRDAYVAEHPNGGRLLVRRPPVVDAAGTCHICGRPIGIKSGYGVVHQDTGRVPCDAIAGP